MTHKPTLPAGLYALIDDSVRTDLTMLQKARAVIGAGVGVLQLRLEKTADRPALELIRQVVAEAILTKVIVNDRVDLALLGGAHGVHLGADDLPVGLARKLLGPAALIGATTRSLTQIEQARDEGADHVGLGPIFSTRTKQVEHPPMGVVAFAEIVARSPLPVVGIAGITLETIGEVARVGAHAAAVAGDLLNAGDVTTRARQLSAAFELGRQRR